MVVQESSQWDKNSMSYCKMSVSNATVKAAPLQATEKLLQLLQCGCFMPGTVDSCCTPWEHHGGARIIPMGQKLNELQQNECFQCHCQDHTITSHRKVSASAAMRITHPWHCRFMLHTLRASWWSKNHPNATKTQWATAKWVFPMPLSRPHHYKPQNNICNWCNADNSSLAL